MNSFIPEALKEDSDKQRQEQAIRQQIEFKNIGNVRKVPGHTLFSYNKVTGEIKRADTVKEVCLFEGRALRKEKTVVEKDCYYEQALNTANFIKRLRRQGFITINMLKQNIKL